MGILLLGYGGEGHPGGYLTDAIQVVFVDFDKAAVNLISIPRDLWVKFPGSKSSKINAGVVNLSGQSKAPLKDGTKSMENFLSDLLGVKIDYFVAVDFVGFQRAVGLKLKGLDVTENCYCYLIAIFCFRV